MLLLTLKTVLILQKHVVQFFQFENMSEEKTKPAKFEVDFLITAFSKPLTIALVISIVFLILFCLHRPNDNMESDRDSLIMPLTSDTEIEVCSFFI